MKSIVFFLLVIAAPLAAQEITHYSLQDAMAGATAMTTMPDGSVLIANPAGSHLCVLDVSQPFWRLLLENREQVTRSPQAICVSVDSFEALKND